MCINVYLAHVSDHKFKDCVDLLLLTDKNNTQYVYIKDFDRFMCNKTNCRAKKRLFQILLF